MSWSTDIDATVNRRWTSYKRQVAFAYPLISQSSFTAAQQHHGRLPLPRRGFADRILQTSTDTSTAPTLALAPSSDVVTLSGNNWPSMTGYGYATGRLGNVNLNWSVESGNSEGLKLTFSIPAEFDQLKKLCRKTIEEAISRGAVITRLTITRTPDTVFASGTKWALSLLPPLLNWKGADQDQPDKALQAALLSSFHEAVGALLTSRIKAGIQIERVLTPLLRQMEHAVQEAGELAAAQTERDVEGLAPFKALNIDWTQHEELWKILASALSRSNVEEELNLLGANLQLAREALAGAATSPAEGKAPGNALKIIAKGLVRESSTASAKSKNLKIARVIIVLQIKIKEFSEQVANVE